MVQNIRRTHYNTLSRVRFKTDEKSELSLDSSKLEKHDQDLDHEQAVNLHWACLIRLDDLARLTK
jgi:hypothetical protein